MYHRGLCHQAAGAHGLRTHENRFALDGISKKKKFTIFIFQIDEISKTKNPFFGPSFFTIHNPPFRIMKSKRFFFGGPGRGALVHRS